MGLLVLPDEIWHDNFENRLRLHHLSARDTNRTRWAWGDPGVYAFTFKLLGKDGQKQNEVKGLSCASP